MKIINVVGARPNFIKIAPIIEQMEYYNNLDQILIHTGQHYDKEMSKLFFEDLEIPQPNINLGVGSASHAVQTAQIMERFEPVLLRENPDMIVVVGDVNSTIACALVATKLHIKIAHVEAGLRSFDRRMPEEINRVLTDAIADLLFTTCREADENLKREGIVNEKIHFVGNVMIDSLTKFLETANFPTKLANFEGRDFALLTLHRPSNVDNPAVFSNIIDALRKIGQEIPIIFPIHPRTSKKAHEFGFYDKLSGSDGLILTDPLSYLEFFSSDERS